MTGCKGILSTGLSKRKSPFDLPSTAFFYITLLLYFILHVGRVAVTQTTVDKCRLSAARAAATPVLDAVRPKSKLIEIGAAGDDNAGSSTPTEV